MKDTATPTDNELREIEAAARELVTRRWTPAERDLDLFTTSDGDGTLYLYARKPVVEELSRAITLGRETVPRLVAAVRALKGEVEDLRARPAQESAKSPPKRPSTDLGDVPAALVAPFRPNPRALDAAKSDPLAALAVQVSRAMQPDAKDIDRARLIAMAFAASRGDMDTFWAATKQRSAKKLAGTS
jgi:hypothetical protein